MNFLFAAYTIVWVLLFAYVVSIARRQKKVQEDLAQLQESLSRIRK
jgi:CcmD family protein